MTTMAWPEAAGAAPAVLSSLQRPAKDEAPPAPGSDGGFVEAVAGAYEAGLPIRFEGLFAGEERRRIALPGYPFQRERYWIEAPRRRRSDAGHPLLGARHESASGEIAFDTEVFPSDPAWLSDHRVFGRLIAPGALYGAMAASATLAEGSDAALVEDFSMQNALVFPDEDAEDDSVDAGRRVQVLLDDAEDGAARRVRILSRGDGEDGWSLHAEGRVATSSAGPAPAASSLDIEGLKAALAPVDLAAYYRAKAAVGIDLGPVPSARWTRSGRGRARRSPRWRSPPGSSAARSTCTRSCSMAASRSSARRATRAAVRKESPICLSRGSGSGSRTGCRSGWSAHVQVRQGPQDETADAKSDEVPEVHAADLRFYDQGGTLIGELAGFTVKRATRAALLSAVEGIDELLYEVVWQDCALAPGIVPADFLTGPSRRCRRHGALHRLPGERRRRR